MLPCPERAFVSAWLTDLDYDWSALTAAGREVSFQRDQAIFHEGEPAEMVYLISEGRVRLSTFAVDGRERHLMIVGTNGIVGDCGLPTSGRHVVSALASSPTRLLAIPAKTLLRGLEREPAVARQHAALASRRFRVLLQQLELQAHNSASRRVCHHLVGLSSAYGMPVDEGVRIGITYTQEEMGNICGLSRVSVSNIFSRLRRDGIVALQQRHTVVKDPAALEAIARGHRAPGL
jgi:CRP/FNR family transcriptional regulator